MDHEVAARTHAAERYLLGEMSGCERDAFEEHFFDCAACAGDIRSGSALLRELKSALRERRSGPQSSPAGWLSWLRPRVLVPTFAALSLAVVVAYQNTVVMPDLKAPRSMSSALILDGTTRGSAPSVKAGDPLRFLTGVDSASDGRLYVELDDRSGSRVRSGEVSAPAPNRPLDVFFPGRLAVGNYQLVVRDGGASGREVARSAFEIVDR